MIEKLKAHILWLDRAREGDRNALKEIALGYPPVHGKTMEDYAREYLELDEPKWFEERHRKILERNRPLPPPLMHRLSHRGVYFASAEHCEICGPQEKRLQYHRCEKHIELR